MNSLIVKRHTSFIDTIEGVVKLQLFQYNSGYNPLGTRLGFEAESNEVNSQQFEVSKARVILNKTTKNTIALIPLQKGFEKLESELKGFSHDRTIVCLRGVTPEKKNLIYIATNGNLIKQEKISLSSEDINREVKSGNQINIFKSENGSVCWAALNCHDYTDINLIELLLKEEVEILLIVSSNPATRLYWEYALADIHRLFCFIGIANIAEIGGSAVYAPFRKIGKEKNAHISAGGQIFSSKGNSEFDVIVTLEIEELRKAKKEFIFHGLQNLTETSENNFTPIFPSEHYIHTYDRQNGSPLSSLNEKFIEVHDLNYIIKKPRIAIAQLNDIGFDAYITTKYRIRNSAKANEFHTYLELKLKHLLEQLELLEKTESGKKLDFLVFPEVFIPRSFLPILQKCSNENGITILCGVDYPDGDESQNANECFIIQPDQTPEVYRKITRSQYDAISADKKNRMNLSRGEKLLRFIDKEGKGFGVLICYDFSHIDLLKQINMANREYPLDFLFVIAYNPFSKLYKSCCIADSHRFYQFIIMCNVSRYGGSGVFGPIRTSGERQTLIDMGIGVESFGICEIDIDELRLARKKTDSELHFGKFMRKPGLFQQT